MNEDEPADVPVRDGGASIRTATPRSLPVEAGVLGIALVLAALAVVSTVGIHASRLGTDPAWLFDCNDTTCEDLWADARTHYLRVTAGAALAGLLGWVLTGLGRPADGSGRAPALWSPREDPAPAGSRGSLVAVFSMGALVLGPPAAVTCGAMALGVSRPFALAVLCGLGALMSIAVWRDLKERTGTDQAAWFGAFAVVLLGAVGGAGTSAALFTVLFVVAPVAAIPVSIIVMLLARHGMQRWLTDGEQVPAPPGLTRPRVGPGRGTARKVALACGVLVIIAGAIVAGWPVEAPPEDAWRYGAG